MFDFHEIDLYPIKSDKSLESLSHLFYQAEQKQTFNLLNFSLQQKSFYLLFVILLHILKPAVTCILAGLKTLKTCNIFGIWSFQTKSQDLLNCDRKQRSGQSAAAV